MALILRWLRRFWPAWVFLAILAMMPLGTLAGGALGLDYVRDRASIWAALCAVLAGIPLLLAWAAWSLLGVRHWAGRVGIFVALMISVIGAGLWLFLAHPPQM